VLQAPVLVLQTCPVGHVPQVPPHPSGPQLLPEHWGTQLVLQSPFTQACPLGQLPQLAPQPSSPHSFAVQSPVQLSTHLPAAQYLGQVPQELPQPSSPHSLPVQLPAHTSWHCLPSPVQN